MNFYSFDDIKNANCCLRFAKEILPGLGFEVKGDRIQAKWRGGDGFNVAVAPEGWYDHKAKDGGSVISLCALTKFGGDTPENIQLSQDFLGGWLGLAPKISPAQRGIDHRDSPRYRELVASGYAETAHYDYTDAEGRKCFTVYRLEHPSPAPSQKRKEFVQCSPYALTIKDAPKHLYNLPAVAASSWAVVVEGEKDADTLIRWGLPATTCNNGSANWRKEYTEELRGRDVVICRDNDDAGNAHAHVVMRELAKAAKSLRVVCPSALPKGDVTDWAQKEGGTPDKFLSLVRSAALVTPEEAMWSDEEYALHKAKEANKKPFANFTTQWTTAKGKDKPIDLPRPMGELVADARVRLLGFPKRIGDFTLFDHDRDTGRVEVIQGRDDLFAWIGEKTGHVVKWRSIADAPTKGEFYYGLLRTAQRFEKTSDIPDYPMRSDVYYTFKDKLKPTPGHEAFKTLLSFFSPEDENSATLLAVFFAAPLYYRYGVPRPCWVVDTHEAQGVGKTTLVNRVAELYGCRPISTNRNELERNIQELYKRIVSVQGRNSRFILLDNLKGEFDDPQWAELVTTPSFSGRAPYGHGEENRPNDLTFAITANSATIRSDTASRSFFLFLKRHNSEDGWIRRVTGHIADRRMEIFGDIFHILSSAASSAAKIETRTRFPDFEREVVFPMCGCDKKRFDAVMDSLLSASASANIDIEKARDIADEVRDGLRKAIDGFNPDTGVAFIRTAVLNFWVKPLKSDSQDVWNMVNTHQLDCFHPRIKAFPRHHSHPHHGRGILYIGPNVAPVTPFCVPIVRLNGERQVVLVDRVESSRLKGELAAEGWFSRARSVVPNLSEDAMSAPVQQTLGLSQPGEIDVETDMMEF